MSFPTKINGVKTYGCDRQEPCMFQTDTGLHSDGTPCKYGVKKLNLISEYVRSYEVSIAEDQSEFFMKYTGTHIKIQMKLGFVPSQDMLNKINKAIIDAANAEIDLIKTEISCGVSHVD